MAEAWIVERFAFVDLDADVHSRCRHSPALVDLEAQIRAALTVTREREPGAGMKMLCSVSLQQVA